MDAADPAPPLANAYWVLPGQLLAGEHPAGPTPESTLERLSRLRSAGIASIIDLTTPQEVGCYDDALPLAVEYRRKPIPDHGVPERREHMDEILDCLHAALRAGRPSYVHCRAGIGRSATVMGCFLVERGLTGEQALDELARLWKQSERSRDWAIIPETPAQAEYVRVWTPRVSAAPQPDPDEPADPLLDPGALSAARALRERFLGALLGLAVGDAVAAATQYRRAGSFAPVADLLGGGPFGLPRGGWSDDTAMALCLAESLLECGGFDPLDQVERYRRWQREGHLSATGRCLGITASTSRALAVAKWRQQPFSGSHDPAQLDPEPLSRVAPVVLFYFASPQEAVRSASEAARTTCQVNTVLAACADLARALLAALGGASKSRVLAHQSAAPGPGAGKGAAQALSGAFEAFGATDTFRDAVLHAANLGGDSDVTAAVCGQLAGAFYGANAIPRPWREALLRAQLIESFADRLLARALERLD
jgi:ADP-ribosyl-[dinitrogen reductase] hydrolase